jgi:hypothetical protein
MAIQGKLSTMTLPDVLQWIAHAFQSGHLQIVAEDRERGLFISDGHLVAVQSNDPCHRLTHVLERRRLISERQAFLVDKLHEVTGASPASLLAELDLLRPDWIQELETELMVERVFELFAWNEGEFVFRNEIAGRPPSVARPVAINQIIIEGCRRMDEWARFQESIPSREEIYSEVSDPDAAKLTDEMGAITPLALLDGRRCVAELLDSGGFSEFQVYSAIHQALADGLIQHVGRDERYLKLRGARKHIERARTLLAEGKSAAALRAAQKAVSIDPDSAEAAELLEQIHRSRREEVQRLLSRNGVRPRIVLAPTSPDFPSREITPSEAFILSRIDGRSDLHQLQRVCSVPREQLFDALYKFLTLGIIAFDNKGKGSGRPASR